jgi:signal transduction histidine kinase
MRKGRRSRRRDEKFENLFDALPMPTYTWRRSGDDFVLESFNGAADAASAHRVASFVGRTARDVYADEPEILADFDRAATTEESFRREMWYSVPETDERYALEVTYAPVTSDTLVVQTVSRTERILAERELANRLEDLRVADADRRRLLDDLARAQERERERIAEEIRDDAVEPLVAVALRLQTIRRTAGAEVAESVAKLEGSITDAIARLRHLTFTLHPEALAHTTLAVVLRDLMDRMTSRTGIRASLDNRLTRESDGPTKLRAFRIAQHAISNAFRHADPSQVSVTLDERDGSLVVSVVDDGVGFDATSATAVPDGGLTLGRRLAQLAGGALDVRSAPGAGTTVELTLPASW